MVFGSVGSQWFDLWIPSFPSEVGLVRGLATQGGEVLTGTPSALVGPGPFRQGVSLGMPFIYAQGWSSEHERWEGGWTSIGFVTIGQTVMRAGGFFPS